MPEQEFRPPRSPARPGYSGRDDDDPPPWANMPPIRPPRSHRRTNTPVPNPASPLGGAAEPADRTDSPGAPAYPTGDPVPADRTDSAAAPAYPMGGPVPADRREGPGAAAYGDGAAYEDGPAYGNGAHGDSAYGQRAYEDDRANEDQPVPQWAGPDAEPEEETPAPAPRAPGRRALAHAARRRRRWFMLGGALVVLAGAVVAVVLLTTGGSGPAPVTPDGLITTFQPGELRQVPDACKAVPAATVAQYLPGQAHQSAPLAVNGTAESACNWTIDKPPVYRLMELNVLAYAPNGLASGNGSATQAARDAFASARQNLVNPSQHAVGSRATVTAVSGLGDEAFSAQQVFKVGGAVTDVATVEVRYHNVIVTATLNGLDHSNKGNYGPVSPSQLAAAALAFARAAEAALH